MRAGWKTYKLGSICDFHGGSQPPKGEWIKSPKEGYVRMLQIRDFTKSRDFDIEYVRLTDKLRLCKEDDILIGRYGASVGKILTGLAGAYNVAIIKATPDENVVCKSFIRRVFEAPGFQALLGKVSTQRTAQAGFSKEDIADYEVSLPPLPEQQRIVDILDQEFAKIDALKANAEKSLQAAKDLFQATTDTMLGNDKWRELTVGEIAKIKGGKRVPKGYKLEKEPTAHRYIRVADFTDQGTIRPESVLYISDEVYKTIKAYTISSKDVYISIAGTIGKSGIIPDALDGANLTENACKLVLGPDFYNRFVFFATKTSSFKKQVETLTMQAAQPKLALTRLATIRVRVPSSIQEQETIVERLDGVADTIAILQDNYQKTLTLCDDLKQSLLRKAFNGEL